MEFIQESWISCTKLNQAVELQKRLFFPHAFGKTAQKRKKPKMDAHGHSQTHSAGCPNETINKLNKETAVNNTVEEFALKKGVVIRETRFTG